MQRYPVAYLRRSTADTNDPGDVSRETQEQAVRALAVRDGHNGNLVTFTDWSRSASESKSGARTQYAAMLARVEAGEVSHVYAYALDRLNRSLIMSARFARACEDRDVRIVTTREGEVRHDSPAEWLRWTILATFGEYELRTIQSRAAGALAVRKGRGDYIGRAGYGFRLERDPSGAIVQVTDPARPLAPVLDAVREAGSILGACKLLTERAVPVPQGPSMERRLGNAIWHPTPLRKIIARNAPELLPKAGPTGRRQPSRSSVLAQLLVCHCGHVLTPEPGRKSYRCTAGNRTGREAHGPMWIAESALLPWVKAEAARHDLDAVLERDADTTRRASLEASMKRLTTAYVNGGIPDDDYLRDLALIQTDIAAIDAAEMPDFIPPAIDWTWPMEAVNAGLRALWRSIQLGPDLRPVKADWRTPEWRR